MYPAIFDNLDLLVVGVASASISILGFVVYFNNRKSATSKAFLAFSLVTIIWGAFNYINYQTPSPSFVLWALRMHIFSAVWHAFAFYSLFHVFPLEEANFPKRYRFFVLPLVIVTSALTLTPLTMVRLLHLAPAGQVSTAELGPGMALFAIVAGGLVLRGLYLFVRKFLRATGNERKQFRTVLIGTVISFACILTFNLVLPAGFDNVRFIPLGPLFIFPFVIFTFFAVSRYHFLNVKVVTTEVLTFLLTIVSLIEVITSHDPVIIIFRLSIFVLVLSFGILLIRSVISEVRAREELSKLSQQLEDANEQLKKLDEAKSEFVSIASHQLRTPLTVIKGYISMIIEGSFGKIPAKQQDPIEKIYASANRLIELVENLLSVSRIESGRMKFNFAPTNMVELAKSVVEEIRPAAENKKLQFSFKEPKQPIPQLNLDGEKLRQVMMNLADNAVKYTPKGSVVVTVDVIPGKEGTHTTVPSVVFAVTDTGAGVGEEEQKQLFQKFNRGEGGKLNTRGTGLGLYVGRMMIEAHHGSIWVTSPGVNKGSTFAFSIPLPSRTDNAVLALKGMVG
ncbi:MAG: ATP-binding protein [Patescibacteria group bacterium]|jgi:signal transduction histidine kinase